MVEDLQHFAVIRELFHSTANRLARMDQDADGSQVETEVRMLTEAKTALQNLESEVKRLQRAEAQLTTLMSDYGCWIEATVRPYCAWTDDDIDHVTGEPAMLASIEAALAHRLTLMAQDDELQS